MAEDSAEEALLAGCDDQQGILEPGSLGAREQRLAGGAGGARASEGPGDELPEVDSSQFRSMLDSTRSGVLAYSLETSSNYSFTGTSTSVAGAGVDLEFPWDEPPGETLPALPGESDDEEGAGLPAAALAGLSIGASVSASEGKDFGSPERGDGRSSVAAADETTGLLAASTPRTPAGGPDAEEGFFRAYGGGRRRNFLWRCPHPRRMRLRHFGKIGLVLALLAVGAGFFAFCDTTSTRHLAAVAADGGFSTGLSGQPQRLELRLSVQEKPDNGPTPTLRTSLEQRFNHRSAPATRWREVDFWETELLDVDLESEEFVFKVDEKWRKAINGTRPSFRLRLSANCSEPLGVEIEFSYLTYSHIIVAAVILLTVYLIIIFEMLHRTVAALVGAVVALGALAGMKYRPSLEEVVGWIDFDTIGILIGMMVLVGIFGTTGFFEWAAIKAYRLARGKLWRLTVFLCVFVMVVSAFLDNVTTILLVLPCTVRLCSVFDVDPVPIILAEVMMSNIGGTATIIGDPPNIIIVSDRRVQEADVKVDFANFMMHMIGGVLLAAFAAMALLRVLIGRKLRTRENMGKLTEIHIWRRTARKLRSNIEEERQVKEYLNRYIDKLQRELKSGNNLAHKRQGWAHRLGRKAQNDEELDDSMDAEMARRRTQEQKDQLKELEEKYRIRNRPLFVQTVIVLLGVIIILFVHSFAGFTFSLAWVAIFGALVLCVLAGIHDVDEVLERVEWGTLLFFAALFVLMRALEELGLISFLAENTQTVIAKVPAGRGRLAAAVSIIVVMSGIVSAFMDNIPFTINMLPIVHNLAGSELGLPLGPLLWSLSFGTCFGGNGTLVGASANVVAAGIAEGEGHQIRFMQFMKVGFPVMVLTIIVACCYMLLFHVLIPWY